MAALGQTHPTIADVASRTHDGKIDPIVEILKEQNEVLDVIPWAAANDGTGHRTTIRSGLPAPTWRQLNYGVQPTKARTVPVRDTTGMLAARSEIDVAVAKLNGNTNEFRLSEDVAHLEGMNQAFSDTLIYGNTAVNPERFMGLAPRYSSLAAENGENIISGGGSGSDNTSIWLVVWGLNTVHGIYTAGFSAGIQHKDKGEQEVTDAAGGKFDALVSTYEWHCGLVLRDWRYCVRIANIDASDLTANAASGANLIDLMTQAVELVPNINMGKASFMANRTVRSFLRRQTVNKANVNLSLDQVAGRKVVTFDGIPVYRMDAILNTEATVS